MLDISSFARIAFLGGISLAASSSYAEGVFIPEIGIGYTSGENVFDSGVTSATAGFGYLTAEGFGARAIVITEVNPIRDFNRVFDKARIFRTFFGVQGMVSLPLNEKFSLNGGLGLGRTSFDRGGLFTEKDAVERTDGIVSAGLRYQFAHHFSMELNVSRLTNSKITSKSLQFQFPF